MATISASAPVVQASGLWKRFGDVAAVQDVSLSVRPGEIIGLVGPNGAGKTTTIRMLLDITQPDEGEVSVFGASMNPEARERIGYLPEERGLYRSLRIIPNILYLAELKGVPRERALRRADELLQRLGLGAAPRQEGPRAEPWARSARPVRRDARPRSRVRRARRAIQRAGAGWTRSTCGS